MPDKTHREVNIPTITSRYLADFMAASERARRTIIRDCKYISTARKLQHDEAMPFISEFIRSGSEDIAALTEKAKELRDRMDTGDFDRKKLDINADFIEQFATVSPILALPKSSRILRGDCPPHEIGGLRVKPDIKFRTRRITKTNKIHTGAAALRYAKGKPLSEDIGNWQAAFIHGYLRETSIDPSQIPDWKLCLTIDAQSGNFYDATSSAVSMFNNMKAACATIAERWDNIGPPPNAVL